MTHFDDFLMNCVSMVISVLGSKAITCLHIFLIIAVDTLLHFNFFLLLLTFTIWLFDFGFITIKNLNSWTVANANDFFNAHKLLPMKVLRTSIWEKNRIEYQEFRVHKQINETVNYTLFISIWISVIRDQTKNKGKKNLRTWNKRAV